MELEGSVLKELRELINLIEGNCPSDFKLKNYCDPGVECIDCWKSAIK